MTAPTPAEVEALARLWTRHEQVGDVWDQLHPADREHRIAVASEVLAARLPSRDDTLREKVEALAARLRRLAPWMVSAADTADALTDLLAEAEPQPECDGTTDQHGFCIHSANCPRCDEAERQMYGEPQPEPEGERCPSCGGLNGAHGLVHRYPASGGRSNLPCPLAPVPSPVAAEERCDNCDSYGKCYFGGGDGQCPAPEPVAAAPDEEGLTSAEKMAEALDREHYTGSGCGTSGTNACSNCFGGRPDGYEVMKRILAAGYLPPAEVARVVAEAKAEALDEFGDFIATPKHPGLDGPTLYQVYLEAHARADDLRAALVGGPDETGGGS